MPEISPIINGGAISRWVESTPSEETLLALNENGQVVASNAVMQSALPAPLKVEADTVYSIPARQQVVAVFEPVIEGEMVVEGEFVVLDTTPVEIPDTSWDAIEGKPAEYPPEAHTHAIADVDGLSTALSGKASSVHTHAISDVTNLQTSLDAKAPLASPALTGTPTAPTASAATSNTQIATTKFVGDWWAASADKTKLNGIATGATANSPDATLLARANHTGVQAISTITGLQTSLDGKAPTNHTHAVATTSADGFMSATDKLKFDAIASLFPIFTQHPQSIEVYEGQDATFTVSVTAGSAIQVEQSTDGVSWSDVVGATGSSYTKTATVKATDNGVKYRWKATKNGVTAYSDAATLSVWNPTNLPIDYWIDFTKNTFTDRSTTPTTTANLGDPIGTVLSVGNSSLGFLAFSDVGRPTRTSLGASFDGVDDAMNGFTAVRDTTKNKEYMGIFLRASCPSVAECLVSAGEGASLNPRLQLQATSTSLICSTRRVDGDATYVTSATGLADKGGVMLGFGLIRDFGSGRISLLRDGESEKTETYEVQGLGATSDTSAQRYVLGGTVSLTPALRYTGVIGEVVGTTTRLSTDEEIKLARYLNR